MFSIYLVGIPVYYYLLIFNSNNGNSCNQLVSESNYRVDGSALVRVGANEVGCDAQAAHKCDWAACTWKLLTFNNDILTPQYAERQKICGTMGKKIY